MQIKTISHVGRFKDVLTTLVKYGFDDVVERLDLPGMDFVRSLHKTDTKLGTCQRVRLALEDLGPTFIKFGQIMSQRPDLVPKDLIEELQKLQDEVAPTDTADIRQVIEKSFEKPFKGVFSIFDEQPQATGSLSQVHRAVLKDTGQIVAVKVQRPGIRQTVKTDIEIMGVIADQLHDRVKDLEIYDLPNLVRVSGKTLLRELDFAREAHHMEIARTHLADDNGVSIPKTYPDYSTDRVLVMEFVQGTRLKGMDLETLDNRQDLAKRGMRTVIKQILKDGFFHADPHPGNVHITRNNDICFLDWGMVGRLTDDDREELINLVDTIVKRDSARLVEALLLFANTRGSIDRRGLERDLLDVFDTYYALPLKDLSLGHLLLDLTELLGKYQLQIPADFSVMVKALVSAEGTARMLHPDLNVIAEAEPHIRELVGDRFRPRALLKNLRYMALRALALQKQLPRRLLQIVEKVERGNLSVQFEHKNLDPLQNTLENTFNRLTFGIIIAALIIGSSLIVTTGVKPLLFGLPALGLIGYCISACLGLWLVWNIIRKRSY
jgi:ubiquinone biosynthesis protein